jgi:Ca-activated chloride channel homolog
MRLTFETYWPLILALIVPVLWWMRRFTVADLSPKHLFLSTAIRTVIVMLLVLAMMQPVVRLPGASVSAVYLLDVSQSVSPSAIQEAIQWIRKTNDAGKPATSWFIAFAGNSIGFERLEDLTQVSVSSQASRNAVDQSQTNIAAAVERALRSFSPDHLKRLVLVSDGNENAGDIATVLPRLRTDHVEVFTVPLPVRSNQDVWVENLMAPPQVNADEQFPLEVHVYSPSDTTGTIEIRNGTKTLVQKSVSLKKGLNRVAFETSVAESSGTVVLEATLRTKDDPFPENNVFRQPVVVVGRPRILYVEGHPPSAGYLRDALTMEGFSVDVVAPEALPQTAEDFGVYDAVILSDVDAKGISEPQMEGISTYVRDLGGGFILAGGDNVYGEGGYSKTPLEDALPATFDVKKPRQTVSMIVILDKSGSMAGDKIRYAKEATKAPVALLKDTDHFGVLTFNFSASWALRPQAVVDRPAILNAIDEIGVGGETNLYPAMKEAFTELQKQSDEIKHVIILSDGRTLTDDFAGLTKQMADAKITVSTVSVGQEADQDLMAKIASWGKGKTYYAEDPAGVPQIFNQDLESSAGESLQESSFKPIVIKSVEAFKGIDWNLAPRLQGYVQTKARPMAEVLLEAYKDRPLLARWQFGLGKTVVFTSDVKDRWAVDWLKWNGYSKFWSQTVRDTMRRQDTANFDMRVERTNETARITVDAVGQEGRFRDQLHMQVHVVAPDQSSSVIDLPQTGPGSYEASIPLHQQGTYMFRAGSDGTDGASRVLAYSYPAEYHFYPTDVEKLRTISAETGGVFQPSGPEIFEARGDRTFVPIMLWPWLSAIALALYVVDVLLRRFRLFEVRETSWDARNI